MEFTPSVLEPFWHEVSVPCPREAFWHFALPPMRWRQSKAQSHGLDAMTAGVSGDPRRLATEW